MAYVKIPVDLTQVKPKLMLNLTKRQLIWFPLGILTGLPFFFLLNTVNTMLAVLAMILGAFPCFMMAMFQWHGLPLEVFARYYFRMKKLPAKRPYITQNQYVSLCDEWDTRREIKRILKMAYQRTHSQKLDKGEHSCSINHAKTKRRNPLGKIR